MKGVRHPGHITLLPLSHEFSQSRLFARADLCRRNPNGIEPNDPGLFHNSRLHIHGEACIIYDLPEKL
jgi:hypothetical protein